MLCPKLSARCEFSDLRHRGGESRGCTHRASMSLWAGLSLMSGARGVVRLGEPGRPSEGMSGGGALSEAVAAVLFRIPFWCAVAAATAEGLTLE